MLKKTAAAVAVSAALLGSSHAFAAPAAGPVTIQGTVTDAKTGAPIEGVYMMLAEVLPDGRFAHLAQAYTTANGYYSFAGVSGLVSGRKYNVLATYQAAMGVYQGDNVTKLYPKPGTYTLDFQLIPLQ